MTSVSRQTQMSRRFRSSIDLLSLEAIRAFHRNKMMISISAIRGPGGWVGRTGIAALGEGREGT